MRDQYAEMDPDRLRLLLDDLVDPSLDDIPGLLNEIESLREVKDCRKSYDSLNHSFDELRDERDVLKQRLNNVRGIIKYLGKIAGNSVEEANVSTALLDISRNAPTPLKI